MIDFEMDALQEKYPQLRWARLFAKLQMLRMDLEHLGFRVEHEANDDYFQIRVFEES